MTHALRLPLLLGALALLAACSRAPVRPEVPPHHTDRRPPAKGELYAPHLRDGGPPIPPDISRIPEPKPVAEPLARYGNRSPYTVLGRTYRVLDTARGYRERGTASWYGNKFHGRPTSSFEAYDMYKFSAAHKTLPLPSYAQVTNLENGRSVVVRVNDRGPFHDDRLIDLSYAAAVKLGMHLKGTASVEVRALAAGEAPRPVLAADAPPARRVPSQSTARRFTPAPVRGESPPPRDAAFGRWLQVASFANRDNAQRLEQRLEDAGVDGVRVVRADVGKTTVWRVRVGPLRDAEAIAATRQRVRALGVGEPAVVDE